MMLWICSDEVLLTRAQMPPMAGALSKMSTSELWETQWAAAEMPVMPAPMMATRGPVSGGGGVRRGGGEKRVVRRCWRRV